MKNRYIEHWDDERDIDHGIIVTLRYGWSFCEKEHQGVMSFETISEAREAVKRKNIYQCQCTKCSAFQPKATQRPCLEHK